MLDDRLAAPERTRHSRCPALGDREEGIDGALSRDQGLDRGNLLAVGPADADGPALDQGDLDAAGPVIFEHGHDIRDLEAARFDLPEDAGPAGSHHDAVLHQLSFGHDTDDVASRDPVTFFFYRLEFPYLVTVQGRREGATRNPVTLHVNQDVEGALNPVKDLSDQAGTQLNRQGGPARDDTFARTQARCFLIDLDRRLVAVHFDDFADQPLFRYFNDIEHVGVTHSFRDDQGAGYLDDFSLTSSIHGISPFICCSLLKLTRPRTFAGAVRSCQFLSPFGSPSGAPALPARPGAGLTG